jgi:hypothetical protein
MGATTPAVLLADPAHARPQVRRAVLLLALFFVVSILAGIFSQGVYHEDDLYHFLMARWARHDPRYLLDSWGRPGFTVLYSTVAWVGRSCDSLQLARALSAVVSAATAWLVFCTARRIGIRHAWATIPLLYLQPLFARLSSTTLTETPLAFYFALATWLLVSQRPGWSAAVMAVGVITRDEAVVLLPLWALAMSRQNPRWWAYLLLLWAVVLHNVLSGWLLGIWPALRWVQPAGADCYGSGTPLTFVPRLLNASGPLVASLAILGGWQLRRRPWGWVISLAALTWFAAETAIYMRGAYSSGGYARFLVPMCPWLALAAAEGLRPLLACRALGHRPLGVLILGTVALWLLCEIEWHWRIPVVPEDYQTLATGGRIGAAIACAAVVAIAFGLCRRGDGPEPASKLVWAGRGVALWLILCGLVSFTPLGLNPLQASLRDVSSLITAATGTTWPVLTLNRWVYHWTNDWVPWTPVVDCRAWLTGARPGTLFVWDRRFCTESWPGLSYAEMQTRKDWRTAGPPLMNRQDGEPELAFFRRQAVFHAGNLPVRD